MMSLQHLLRTPKAGTDFVQLTNMKTETSCLLQAEVLVGQFVVLEVTWP